MDDERKQWSRQFNSNFGAREFLRFAASFIGWTFMGVLLMLSTRSELVPWPFLCTALAFPFVAMTWRPAYWLFRLILGNPNLPPEPMPPSKVNTPHEPRPWWSYLPSIWFRIISLAVLYLAIKYFLK